MIEPLVPTNSFKVGTQNLPGEIPVQTAHNTKVKNSVNTRGRLSLYVNAVETLRAFYGRTHGPNRHLAWQQYTLNDEPHLLFKIWFLFDKSSIFVFFFFCFFFFFWVGGEGSEKCFIPSLFFIYYFFLIYLFLPSLKHLLLKLEFINDVTPKLGLKKEVEERLSLCLAS